MIIWVDDLIIAANDDNVLQCVKEMLKSKFRMKDLWKLTHFLGIDFKQSAYCVKMSQCKYVQKILKRFDMSNCKSRATNCKQKLDYSDDGEEMDDVKKIPRGSWELNIPSNL